MTMHEGTRFAIVFDRRSAGDGGLRVDSHSSALSRCLTDALVSHSTYHMILQNMNTLIKCSQVHDST